MDNLLIYWQNFVNKVIRKHLDESKCRSMQSHKAIETVKETVSKINLRREK